MGDATDMPTANVKRYLTKLFLLTCILSFSNTYAMLPPYQSQIQPIPEQFKLLMQSYTWQPNCPVPLEKLAYVTVTYLGFDNQSHQGILIIENTLAKEITAIFKKIYEAHFPIQLIEPAENFKGNLDALFVSNATLAFTCRLKTASKTEWSLHSYGRAIDINFQQNPYIKGKLLIPPGSEAYLNRKNYRKGMINHNTVVYQAFTKYGWNWGGDWKSYKDYMHFEKALLGGKR